MSKERIWHGGDLDKARRLFPEAPEPWIDLSTGINPIPYSLPDLPAHLFERLPSPGAQMDLEAAAAEAYGAVDAATVMAAPGTQILINLLPALWPRSQVAVLAPTYAEHAHAWRMAMHQVAETASLEQAENADIVVLVNPNNPDGSVVKRHVLLGLSERLQQRGGWLVIDEAFADFETDESLVPHLPDNAIILRSFGKTYGLAGLRLGFAIAASETAMRLRMILGPWAVSGPAIAVGRQALLDRDWRDAAQQARSADARRLDALLGPVSDQPLRGTTLYRLMESGHAPDLFAHLGYRGIWVRRFEHNPRILRFGLPGSEAAWARLGEAIAAFRNVRGSE